MNKSLVDASSYYLFVNNERIERAKKFLLSRGFTRVDNPDSLVGKVLATNVGRFHCDFMAYPVNGLERSSEGYEVEQEENAVIFGNENEGRMDFVQREGSELFVPDYLY